MKEVNNSSRKKQLHKEMMISLLFYAAYFLWWYITGYGMADKDPQDYQYILGLPRWFFFSSILGYLWFSLGTVFLTKWVFKEVSLEEEEDEL
ncbi:MAG: YhdT family protein [Tissierellia bacterium]|nr:YhdT family protein [Tissierellia bacterium]